jgi:phage terminase large subunit-like protein
MSVRGASCPLIEPILNGSIGSIRGRLTADKVTSLAAVRRRRSRTVPSGFPTRPHWLADRLAELAKFPASRHDDQVGPIARRRRGPTNARGP